MKKGTADTRPSEGRSGKLYPDECYNSPYEIPYEKYYQEGYRGVLFDIDNTLVMDAAPANKQAEELFTRLQEIGFKTCIVSNSTKERVELFTKNIDTKAIHMAGKPNPEAYRKAMGLIGCNEKNTIFIGDQLFTDVLGAKMAGVWALLVKPIHRKESLWIKMKRQGEKAVMAMNRDRKS